jgi:hypothetical protein
MFDAKQKRIQKYLNEARGELRIMREMPNFCCDVCGPYGHLFLVCYISAVKALKAFLCFHDHETETTDWKRHSESMDLKHLVTLAARYEGGFAAWMPTAAALQKDSGFDSEPSQSQQEEALRLSGQLIDFAASFLPEELRDVSR